MTEDDLNRYYQIYCEEIGSNEAAIINAKLWKGGLAKEINYQGKRKRRSYQYNSYRYNGLFDFFMGTLEKHHGF